jgi:hypothetical protein
MKTEEKAKLVTSNSVVLQVHADEIKRNKEMLEKQKIEERNALNDKLKTAANLRDENIKRILERLREHVSQAHTLCSPISMCFHPFRLFIFIIFPLTHTQNINSMFS